MKLRKFGSLVGLLALTLAVPACGDDDGASTTNDSDDGEDAGDNDTTKNTDKSNTTKDTDKSNTTKDTDESDATEDAGDSDTTAATDESDEGDAGEGSSSGDNTSDEEGDAGETTGQTDAGETTEDAGEQPAPDCPDLADRTAVVVPSAITADTTWSCENLYILPQDQITVVAQATLTIEPGTQIIGQTGAGLVITTSGKIDANGQSNAPIVFTSSKEVGARAPSDWGGIILLGNAPINAPDGVNQAEGVPPEDGYADYGGNDASHDCGSISYVRIEFAGFQVSPDNELNALGVAGCGTQTELHHIQAHKGSDDGFEFWGGSPTVHHLVSTQNEDDQFDWTEGFTSSVQFVVLQNAGDSAIEADNNEFVPASTPRTLPTLSNFTIVNSEISSGPISGGLIIRRGSWGKIYNSIITGFPSTPVDLRNPETFEGTENGSLTIENTLFFDNAAIADSASSPDDFDEVAFFTDAARHNIFDVDPNLVDPANAAAPDFTPADDTVATGATNPPAGVVDTSANYLGAFEPGGEDWTLGWTAYPQN